MSSNQAASNNILVPSPYNNLVLPNSLVSQLAELTPNQFSKLGGMIKNEFFSLEGCVERAWFIASSATAIANGVFLVDVGYCLSYHPGTLEGSLVHRGARMIILRTVRISEATLISSGRMHNSASIVIKLLDDKIDLESDILGLSSNEHIQLDLHFKNPNELSTCENTWNTRIRPWVEKYFGAPEMVAQQ